MPYADEGAQRSYQAKWASNAQKARRKRNSAEIDALKSAPCTDCGGVFDPVCMDFDHLDGSVKFSRVSAMLGRYSWERIADEVKKCELVCANCHRIRTKKRKTQ